jgi:hypothetical protein
MGGDVKAVVATWLEKVPPASPLKEGCYHH